MPDKDEKHWTDQHEKDWRMEEQYWRENYRSRSYVEEGESFDHYLAAYRFGYEAASRMGGMTWEEAEPVLGREWDLAENLRGDWDSMQHPVHDAWHRVTGEDPGYYRRDGGKPRG